MSLTKWFGGLAEEQKFALMQVAEMNRLRTAAQVIRKMLVSGEYDGSYMCVNLVHSDLFTDNEKHITYSVINERIAQHLTLANYIRQQLPVTNTSLAKDTAYLNQMLDENDPFERRIALSVWYWKLIRDLENRVNQIMLMVID